MSDLEQTVSALRAALAVSPDNMPLRLHLADTLLAGGLIAEAEREYKAALVLSPRDHQIKLRLADACALQGKSGAAIVIAEELASLPTLPAASRLRLARLLLTLGEDQRAASQYQRAIEDDPDLADASFADRLGIYSADEPDEGCRIRVSHQDNECGIVPPEVERPKVNFDNVGGMDKLKDEIRVKIIHPLEKPEVYRAYGKSIGGGILMYGPPGCGKTHLARATAGQVKAGFISVGIHDIVDMYIGQSEKNLHAIFETARKNAPCVLFFDEADALGANRGDLKHSASRQMINQFLSELDGVDSSNEGVLILAATNAPWHIDPAFRRPGRFDRVLFVPPPDSTARAAILRVLLRDKPAADVDVDQVAKKTEGCSGADLKGIIDIAIEEKLRDAVKTGRPVPLTTRDLLGACKEARPACTEWFASARNYALYANQSGLYNDLLPYLKLK